MKISNNIAVKKSVFCLFALIAFLLFFFRGYKTLDPDFGWHLRMGELISKSGISKTDPFSYSMPSYPFVDHEWLTDVILYRLNFHFGTTGLAILFTFLPLISLAIITFKQEKNITVVNFSLVFLVLAFGSFFPFAGIRPQELSWFFLAIFLKIILKPRLFEKFFWFLPLLVFFWVNLHGSFALSIFCLGLVVLLRSLPRRKFLWKEFVSFSLCLSATFINPYGARLWGEVWRSISDSTLRFRIVEWMPSLFEPIFPFLVLVVFSSLIFRYRKQFSWEEKGLFLFFLVQSILSLRNIPIFVVMACPLYVEAIRYTLNEVSEIKYGRERFLKVSFWTLIFSIIITIIQILPSFFSKSKLDKKNYYPISAVEFLRFNLPEGQIFSNYNWGGYLIWKLPEKKVFIDGRMPSWRWKVDIAGESNNAMDDFIKISTKEGKLKEAIKKYGITTVLWPNTENIKEDFWQKLSKIVFKHLRKEKQFDFVLEIKSLGWKEVYKDQTAVIYSKE